MTYERTSITITIPLESGCPICHRSNGVYEIYGGDWAVCDVHRKRWQVSGTLRSPSTGQEMMMWAKKTERFATYEEKVWARNARRFSNYEEVLPVSACQGSCGPATSMTEPGVICGLPDTVQEAISQITEYVRDREADAYSRLSPAKSAKHIYRYAAIVSGWLNELTEAQDKAEANL